MTAMKEEMFILLTCLIACSAVWFSSDEKKYGELKPMDPDVCATQSITFTSLLLIPPKANFSIGFDIKKTDNFSIGFDIRKIGEHVVVGRDMVTEINETVSQLTVYNITLQTEYITEPVYLSVRSFYWQDSGVTSNDMQLGDTTIARVYPIPEKVKDFQCIVINYKSMKCSWNYGIEYGYNMPEVTFEWRIPTHTASWTKCKDLNEKNGYCNWNDAQAGDFKYRNITVRIILKQTCGISVSSEFHVDTSKIVKPNPVSRISSSVINSTCIQLDWEATDSEPQNPKEHRVLVSRDGEHVTNKTIITTLDTERLPHSWTFCGLHPYTKYKFSVTIKPTWPYSGNFSEPRYTESVTYSDKPSASPKVTEGGYNWNLRDCDGNKQRRVCIFMKSVKEEDKNGPLKGLEGRFTAISGDEKPVTNDWAEYVTYGCSALRCTTSYNFTIKARNDNGTADTVSTLLIPAFTSGGERPQFIVESSANTSDVYVSWDDRSKSKATGFLVAWCRNENGGCKSGHEVYWKRVPPNATEAVLQINTSAQDFLYGVSVLTEQGSSGVEWQDCVYHKDTSPTKKPENVIVSEGSEYNTLVVTWDKLKCDYDQPYIDKYILVYKKVGDINYKSINVSQSGEARFVLRDLEADQTYTVTLRAVTRDGRYGPETEPLSGVPVNKDLKPPVIAGIVVAALVTVIFAVVGVVCACRKCRKKAQKFKEKEGAIKIPDDPVQESYKILQRQNSNDSGYGMTPPPDISKKATLRDSSLVLPDDYRCATAGNDELASTTTDTNDLKFEPSAPATDGADTSALSEEPSDVTDQSTKGLMSNRGNNALNGILKDGINMGYISCNGASFDTIGKSQTVFPAIELTSMRSNHLFRSASFGEEHKSDTAFVDSLRNAKSLTTILSPTQVCGNDLAVSDENEFPLAQTEDNCQDNKDITSSTLSFQSPFQSLCKINAFHDNATFESNETSTKNNLEGSTKAIHSSYVTTTEAAKLFPQNPSCTNVIAHALTISKESLVPHQKYDNTRYPLCSKSALTPKSGTVVESLDINSTLIVEQTVPTFPPVNSHETSDSSYKTDTVLDKDVAKEYTTSSGYPSNSVPQPLSNPFEMQTTGTSIIQNKIDSSLCGLKHNTTSENTLTTGFISYPGAAEGKQICDNVFNQTKTKDTVPNVSINANYVTSQEVLSCSPEAIMEKDSDQKCKTGFLSTPTASTFNDNVNLGYVSSVEAVCQPNKSKLQPDDRNVLQDK